VDVTIRRDAIEIVRHRRVDDHPSEIVMEDVVEEEAAEVAMGMVGVDGVVRQLIEGRDLRAIRVLQVVRVAIEIDATVARAAVVRVVALIRLVKKKLLLLLGIRMNLNLKKLKLRVSNKKLNNKLL
jgi:hypothetical protein